MTLLAECEIVLTRVKRLLFELNGRNDEGATAVVELTLTQTHVEHVLSALRDALVSHHRTTAPAAFAAWLEESMNWELRGNKMVERAFTKGFAMGEHNGATIAMTVRQAIKDALVYEDNRSPGMSAVAQGALRIAITKLEELIHAD